MIEPFDWEEYMRNLNRQLSAAGGVPPAELNANPVIDDGPPAESPQAEAVIPKPPLEPTRNQVGLKQDLGIGTFGPMHDKQNRAIDAYEQSIKQYGAATGGQGQPQQFGTPETRAEVPLTSAEAAEAFVQGPSRVVNRTSEPREKMQQRNQAYDDYVQRSRAAREMEREQLANRGARNREVRREKNYDLAENMLGYNAMMGGGGGMGRASGPMAQNVGGAILLGPGMGQPTYGGYGGRSNRNFRDPEWYDLEREKLARLKEKDATTAELGEGRLGVQRTNTQLRGTQIENQAEQAGARQGRLTRKDAEQARKSLENAIAEYRRRTETAVASGNKEDWDRGPPIIGSDGNPVPGNLMPRSYRAYMNRILELTKQLTRAHNEGEYEFEVTPEIAKIIREIKLATDADQSTQP